MSLLLREFELLEPLRQRLADGMPAYGSCAGMILLALAIDRHGERAVVSCSMLAMAAMALVTAAYAQSFYALLPGLAMIGALYAAVPLGGSRAVIAWFPPDRRGLATGLLQGAVPLGSVVAGGLMPVIALWAGWRAALVALGLIGISGGLAFWCFYRGHGLAVASKKRSEIPMRDLLRLLYGAPGYLRLLLAGIAMTSLQFALTAHIIFFLMSAFEYSIAMAAALFSLIQMAGLASRLLLPWMGDHMFPGQRIPFLAAIMTGAAVATTSALVASPAPTVPLAALVCTCVEAMASANQTS
jgi:sugar phosphate permease